MLSNAHIALHKNLKGQRYERLIVINTFTKNGRGWLQCQCDCGKVIDIRYQNVRNGRTKSCGCLRKEVMAQLEYPIGDKHPNWNGGTAPDGRGYLRLWVGPHEYRLEHRMRAEKAIGKTLSPEIPVHHYKNFLVVCENQGYHLLLHIRTKALEGCGNANWRRCRFCKKYDDPLTLTLQNDRERQSYHHKECRNEWDRNRRSLHHYRG